MARRHLAGTGLAAVVGALLVATGAVAQVAHGINPNPPAAWTDASL